MSKVVLCLCPCTDHLGNEFKSQKEMCKFWRISFSTFMRRLKRQWSLKDALTTPTKQFTNCLVRLPKKETEVKLHPMDHLNNYKKELDHPDLSKYWGINPDKFHVDHFSMTLSLKDTLSKPIDK